jgi:DNA-binding CsgD family transcriptional regulator
MTGSPESLTPAQKEVLRLYHRRFSAGEIARELDISTTAVTERLRSARAKLDVSSSAEAARLLFDHENEVDETTQDAVASRAEDTENTVVAPEQAPESEHQKLGDTRSGVTSPPQSRPSMWLLRWPPPWRTGSGGKGDMTVAESLLLVVVMTAVILLAVGLYLLGVKALSSLV